METPPIRSVVMVFMFFLTLLLAWLTYSVIGTVKAIQTMSWPQANGVVISTEVVRVLSSKGPSKFSPVISYTFNVDSVDYSSARYSSTGARGSSEWANEVIDQYRPSDAIKVYYNPRNPKMSVLDTGVQSDDYWMLSLSSFFFVVVLFAFIKQLKSSRNPIETIS